MGDFQNGAMVGVIAGYFFSWLSKREETRGNKQLAELQAQNATQGTQLAVQASQITTLTASLAEREKQHRECEIRFERLSARVEALESSKTDGKQTTGTKSEPTRS